MRSLSLLALLPLALMACGARSAATPSSTLAAVDEPLMPGDQIRVAFSEERQLSGDFPIDESHHAALPMLGRTDVEGITGSELRQRLARAFEEQVRNQTVQVTLLRRVRVLGEVRDPGLYHIDPTMTLLDAIALAGGTTSQGRLDDVDIIRDGHVAAEDVQARSLVGSHLRSGDQIIVPKTSWLSRNAAWLVGGTVSAAAIITTAIINSGN